MYISSIIAYMCGIVSADHTNKFAHVHPLRTNPKFSHLPWYSLWKSRSVDSLDQDEWTRRIKESTWRRAHTNTRQSRPTACRRVSVRCWESCGRACVNRYATWRSMWVWNFDLDIFLIFIFTFIGERTFWFVLSAQSSAVIVSRSSSADFDLSMFKYFRLSYIHSRSLKSNSKSENSSVSIVGWIEKLRRAAAAEGHEWKWGWVNSCFNSSPLNSRAEKFFSYIEKSQSECQF